MSSQSLWALCKKNRDAVSLKSLDQKNAEGKDSELDYLMGDNQDILELNDEDMTFNIPPFKHAYKRRDKTVWTEAEVKLLEELLNEIGLEVGLIAAHFPTKVKKKRIQEDTGLCHAGQRQIHTAILSPDTSDRARH